MSDELQRARERTLATVRETIAEGIRLTEGLRETRLGLGAEDAAQAAELLRQERTNQKLLDQLAEVEVLAGIAVASGEQRKAEE